MRKKLIIFLAPMIALMPSSQAVCTELESFTLNEVIVTATKTPLDTKDVPNAVDIITAAEIQSRNAHTLREIIDSLPGVAINRSGGRRALSIRGFDSRYSMILIDGQRIPAEPDADYELDRLALDNIARIEIVRGNASALYGADAMGGIINLITKKSQEPKTVLQFKNSTLTKHGDNEHCYSLSYDSGRQNKMSFTLAADNTKNDAFFKTNGTTFFPFGARSHVDTRLEYQPTSQETWTLSTSYLQEDTNEYGTMSGLGGIIVNTDIHDDNRRQRYSLDYQKSLPGRELSVTAYHSIWEKYNNTINRLSGQYTNSIYGYSTISGLEARLSRKIDNLHKLTVGGEYRPELFRGTGIQSGDGNFSKSFHGKTYTGSEVKTDYSALYVQDEWNLSPQWLMISSLRFDDSNRFESNLSPKIGLTYSPQPDLRFKFNAGTGFRVPSPNQLYMNLNIIRNGSLVSLLGNSSLQPEKSTFYDVSVERDWGHTAGKITFFYSNVKDMIDEVWRASNEIQYQNIGRANIQGVETSIRQPLSERLNWSLNYTYLDATNGATQERLYNRARHKISSQLSYQAPGAWQANLWVDAYRGYYFQPNATTTSERTYTIWNLNFEKQLGKDQSLIVGAANLFNHRDEDLSLPGTILQIGYRIKL